MTVDFCTEEETRVYIKGDEAYRNDKIRIIQRKASSADL